MTSEHGRNDAFVTSRNFALPNDPVEMAKRLWFNMWQRRLWPYQELQEGNTLYWYDTTEQAIVWRSQIRTVERFEYANKHEVRQQFQDHFGLANLDDPYFDAAPEHGYCLAYKIDSLGRLRVPKPADFRFPQGGWLRFSDDEATAWLNNLPRLEQPDGSAAGEMSTTAAQVADDGYFSPANLQDERKKRLREIVERRGQPDFRNKLIAAYGGRCAITGCDAVAALEAAHIVPYSGPQSNHVSNGLLLRADIHTLFDLDLVRIDPQALVVDLAPALYSTSYGELAGRAIALPDNDVHRPSHEALSQRRQRFLGG